MPVSVVAVLLALPVSVVAVVVAAVFGGVVVVLVVVVVVVVVVVIFCFSVFQSQLRLPQACLANNNNNNNNNKNNNNNNNSTTAITSSVFVSAAALGWLFKTAWAGTQRFDNNRNAAVLFPALFRVSGCWGSHRAFFCPSPE